jgi:hypothetical protein
MLYAKQVAFSFVEKRILYEKEVASTYIKQVGVDVHAREIRSFVVSFILQNIWAAFIFILREHSFPLIGTRRFVFPFLMENN